MLTFETVDSALRKLGYVEGGESGIRGDYFINSYRPSARSMQRKRPLPEGFVEVHFSGPKFVRIETRFGSFDNLTDAIAKLSFERTVA